MNLPILSSNSTKVSFLKQRQKKIFLAYFSNVGRLTSSPTTLESLQLQSTYNLPFSIKLKVVKTVKSSLPQVTYSYIHPQLRFKKSLQFTNSLSKNSPLTGEVTLEKLFSSIIKV